ncbi:MAG: hypothetical protein AAF249_16180 [Pseudomonadota bacterium]
MDSFLSELVTRVANHYLEGEADAETSSRSNIALSRHDYALIVRAEIARLEEAKQASALRQGFDHLLAAINTDVEKIRESELHHCRAIFAELLATKLITPPKDTLKETYSKQREREEQLVQVRFAVIGNVYFYLLQSDIRNAALTMYRFTSQAPRELLNLPTCFYPRKLVEPLIAMEASIASVGRFWEFSGVNFNEKEKGWRTFKQIDAIGHRLTELEQKQQSWRKEVVRRYVQRNYRGQWWEPLYKRVRKRRLEERLGPHWRSKAKPKRRLRQERNAIAALRKQADNEADKIRGEHAELVRAISDFSVKQIEQLERATLRDLIPPGHSSLPKIVQLDS